MSRKADCCKGKENSCCKKGGPSGIPGSNRSLPGPSGVQGLRPPSTSRLVPPSSTSRLPCPAAGPPSQTQIPSCSSRAPSTSRVPGLPCGAPQSRIASSTPQFPRDRCLSPCIGAPSQVHGPLSPPPCGAPQSRIPSSRIAASTPQFPGDRCLGPCGPPSQTRIPPSGSRAPRVPGPPCGAPQFRIPSSRIAASTPQFPGDRSLGPCIGAPSQVPFSRAPPGMVARTVIAGVSRPPIAALSKTVSAEFTRQQPKGGTEKAKVVSRTVITGPSATNVRKEFAGSVTRIGRTASEKDRMDRSSKLGKPAASAKSTIPPPKKQSRLQRFDKNATAELSRRRTAPTTATAATSDTNLLDAIDCLSKAEAAHSFAGAVAAAEAAAAAAPDPRAAEEAAGRGARSFQAEIVDVVHEDVPGLKPIQILGYVGITRPTYVAK